MHIFFRMDIAEDCMVYNYCRDHACLNGATCVNGEDGYTCSCSPVHYGDRCQVRGEKWQVSNHGHLACRNFHS